MFNRQGEVIGIVSKILSRSGGFEGIGFAATSKMVRLLLSSESPSGREWKASWFRVTSPDCSTCRSQRVFGTTSCRRVSGLEIGDQTLHIPRLD